MDKAVKPGDDFFDFVNGTGRSAPRSPPTARSSGSIQCSTTRSSATFARSSRRWRSNPAASGASGRQVGDYYASFMDEAAIEQRGTAPLTPYLARIAAVKDRGGLIDLFADQSFTSPVGIFIDADPDDPTRYATYASQSGLGLPNRDYYLLPGAKYDGYRAAYRDYVIQDADARRHPRRRGARRPHHRARKGDRHGALDARAQPRHQGNQQSDDPRPARRARAAVQLGARPPRHGPRQPAESHRPPAERDRRGRQAARHRAACRRGRTISPSTSSAPTRNSCHAPSTTPTSISIRRRCATCRNSATGGSAASASSTARSAKRSVKSTSRAIIPRRATPRWASS